MTHKQAIEMVAKEGSISAAARRLAEVQGGTANGWRCKLSRAINDGIGKDLNSEQMERIRAIDDALQERGIDARDVIIKGARISNWEGLTKDVHGKAQITPLKGTQIVFEPRMSRGPEWPVVQAATKATIHFVQTKRKPAPFEKVFIIPDVQIGFWRSLSTGKLEPFHDLKAIHVMLQILKDFAPDRIVILGDFLDVSELSKYLQVPEFSLTLQPAIDYAYKLLALIRSIVGPKIPIEFLDGNHERRIGEYIVRNAKAAYGIRRAGDVTGWPVFSVPSLLRLDELKINYSASYPAGQVWLTPKLVCTHQPPKNLTDLRASVIHGHTPQYTATGRTVHYHDGHQVYTVWSVPGLMRIDDTKHKARLVQSNVASDSMRLNWSQGIGLVRIRNDNQFSVDIVQIDRGTAMVGDEVYQGTLKGAA